MTPDAHHELPLTSQTLDIPADYDPVSLRHLGLRSPRPSDLPSDIQGQTFTFDDAFEDLISSHFNGHIQPIRRLAAQSAFLRIMYPQGEPASQQLRRLSAQYHTSIVRRHDSLLFLDNPFHSFGRHQNGLGDLIFALPSLDTSSRNGIEWESQRGDLGSPRGRSTTQGQARFNKHDNEHQHNQNISPFGTTQPQTELDLAEAHDKSSKSSSSPWPSPFDTLWSAVTGGKSHNSSFVSSTHDVVSRVEDGVVTENETRAYTDEQGRRVEWNSERRIDAQTGSVISEKTRRLVDGQEADPYDDSL
ncbi:hypothetical protein LIA77_09525 [Sarocladium implicatum]|nr:hypothetical protein LIA77_09525 [Sarocladium implicatum]